jgi:hypothetical protein
MIWDGITINVGDNPWAMSCSSATGVEKALALRPSVGMRVLRMDRLEQQVGQLTQANTELHARFDSIQNGKDDGGPETARE